MVDRDLARRLHEDEAAEDEAAEFSAPPPDDSAFADVPEGLRDL